jgi:septum formation protein
VKSEVRSPYSTGGKLAIIALGSNVGDSRQNILRAIEQLETLSDQRLLKSSLRQTAPVDCPPGSPPFINAVVAFVPRKGETPESLLARLQRIEKEFGRKPKKVLNEPRPLDLDLIAFQDQTRSTKTLTLPHPRAHQRRFVLEPLSEIAPDLVLPGQEKAVRQLLAEIIRTAFKGLPPLVLASASPRRAELLRQLIPEFEIVASEAPELHHEQLTARELSQVNAYRKARAVAKKFPDALVLGADTLVFVGDKLFGKPADFDEAYRMLEQLQNRTHQVVTGICLLHLRGHRQQVFAETTAVTFHPLDAVTIQRYLVKVNPLDKAGAYAIQEQGHLIISEISGSYSNVVGLPIERLSAELHEWATTSARPTGR